MGRVGRGPARYAEPVHERKHRDSLLTPQDRCPLCHMIRLRAAETAQFRTTETAPSLHNKRARKNVDAPDVPAPRNAAEAGQRAIQLLNAGHLEQFCKLLEDMAQRGIHKLDLSHRPERGAASQGQPVLSELAMQCLAMALDRNPWPSIHELDLAGAHVATLVPLLKVLEKHQGKSLKRLDFSGTRIRKGSHPYCMQARHFQWIAQMVANSPCLQSLALNYQPLLRGQKAGAVLDLPVEAQHLAQYLPEPSDTGVPSSLPELVTGVCAALSMACSFELLELRGCNLSDEDLGVLWPIIDKQQPVGAQRWVPRRQPASVDLRSNPIMSYGNRLVMLADALAPTGELQSLYLPSHFKNVYKNLYEHDRQKLHASLANSTLQILEPFSCASEAEFDEPKSILARRREALDVVLV